MNKYRIYQKDGSYKEYEGTLCTCITEEPILPFMDYLLNKNIISFIKEEHSYGNKARILQAVKYLNVKTVRDVLNLTERDFYRLRNIGSASIAVLTLMLKKYNLALKDSNE